MTRSAVPESPQEADEDHPSLTEGNLGELRRLLLGPWQGEVDRLKHRLDDPRVHAKEVGGILPDAIVERSRQDERLVTALAPTVEEILKTSVRRDPKTLVDALFPVMGPAIRKAILETVKRMIQSFDQIIGQSFSWQGLKWRVEAFRTGKSFGEVVLRHSLLYQVEQVFLIHRETGLLLQHVMADWATAQEPDMVSGMLTAIQDFVHDSFRTEREDTLDAIQVGELTIWIEQGPLAVIAAVIRGSPPAELRVLLVEALENIHLEQVRALESFNGDAAPFDAVRHYLDSCLRARYRPGKRKVSPLSLLIVAASAAILGLWSFHTIQDKLRWTAFLEQLSADPGIVIITTGKRDGLRFVSGLRDPLAMEPSDLLKEAKIDPEQVIFQWEPYYALNDRFVLKRASRLLNPPETVSLRLDNGVLTAEGPAPHQWVREFLGRPPNIPGIMKYQGDGLVDRDWEKLGLLRKETESIALQFETNTTRLVPDQSVKLTDLVTQVQELQSLSTIVGVSLHMEVVGHADSSGLESENLKLSQKRADEILSLLVSRGIAPAVLTAVGVGSKQPLREELSEKDRGFNRSVTFRTILTKPIEQKS
jgi:OOP family OmpA-OmpF porin